MTSPPGQDDVRFCRLIALPKGAGQPLVRSTRRPAAPTGPVLNDPRRQARVPDDERRHRADQFTGPDFSVTKSGSLGPGQFKSYFFNVPAGTPAFKVDMTGGGGAGLGAIRFLRWHPYGVGIESNAVSNCYNGAPGGCSAGDARQLSGSAGAIPTPVSIATPPAGMANTEPNGDAT
jgi:hypothetical protein